MSKLPIGTAASKEAAVEEEADIGGRAASMPKLPMGTAASEEAAVGKEADIGHTGTKRTIQKMDTLVKPDHHTRDCVRLQKYACGIINNKISVRYGPNLAKQGNKPCSD